MRMSSLLARLHALASRLSRPLGATLLVGLLVAVAGLTLAAATGFSFPRLFAAGTDSTSSRLALTPTDTPEPTPTPEPTSTPTPEPTATPVPRPTATPVRVVLSVHVYPSDCTAIPTVRPSYPNITVKNTYPNTASDQSYWAFWATISVTKVSDGSRYGYATHEVDPGGTWYYEPGYENAGVLHAELTTQWISPYRTTPNAGSWSGNVDPCP